MSALTHTGTTNAEVGSRLFSYERKYAIPIVLHAYDGPAFRLGLVERFVEVADRRLAIIGKLAFGVGVMYQAHKTRAVASRRPLQHLQIAVGIAEGEDRTTANMHLDADRLAGLRR